MEHYTSASTQSRTDGGILSWLSGESFSSLLRDLTLSQPHREIMRAIRNAGVRDWQIDGKEGVVTLDSPNVSARFFPRATGDEAWLVATTPHGEVTLARNNSLSNQVERRLHRRIEGYRAQEARGITPEWLTEMTIKVTDRSMDWNVERGGVERRWFGEGSYTETSLTSFSTTLAMDRAVWVRRLESVTSISSKDAYREDQRFAQQSLEYGMRDVMPKVAPIPPFVVFIPTQDSFRPEPPLRYGISRSVSFDVQVNSPAIDKITGAFGLSPKPIVSMRREQSL